MTKNCVFFSLALLSGISSQALLGMLSTDATSDLADTVDCASDRPSLNSLLRASVVSEGEFLLLHHGKSISEGAQDEQDDTSVSLVLLQKSLPSQSRVLAACATLKKFCASLVPQEFNKKTKLFTPKNPCFCKTNVERVRLYNWDLSATNWDGSVFSNTCMNGVRCVCASMKHSVMGFSEPIRIHFSDFSHTNFEHASFSAQSEIVKSKFVGTNFRNADFKDSVFKGSDFHGANFSDAFMESVLFVGSDLRNACFRNTHLVSCSLGKREEDCVACDLCGADFTGARIDRNTARLFACARVNKETLWLDGNPMTAGEAAVFGMQFVEE